MRDLVDKLLDRKNLTRIEAQSLVQSFLSGDTDPILMTAALIALKMKGETPTEIAGAVEAMVAKAMPFPTTMDCLDTCGTGGDGLETVNISTASAIVAAAAGCRVVKHGNRSVSSKSGSADILESLGLPLDLDQETQQACLENAGICFLFAPSYHPAVKAVMPVRRTLKTRTLFNILGPLSNPARPAYQILGVYDPALANPLGEALIHLGVKRALIVHGSGLDELALHGPSELLWVEKGKLQASKIHPTDLGLTEAPVEALKGGSPAENAAWLRDLLRGQGAEVHQQAVALNVGAALWVYGKASNLKDGIQCALDILNTSKGWETLKTWLDTANGS